MFSGEWSLAIWARALPRASSRTSRPRPESTWEKPLGSRPSPRGSGTWGRYPKVPRMRALPVDRTLRPGSSMTTEMNVDLPVPFRPTRPTFSPAPMTNEASRSRVRSPISMVREDPTIMGGSSPRDQQVAACRRGGIVDGLQPPGGQMDRSRTVGVATGDAERGLRQSQVGIETVEQVVHLARGRGQREGAPDHRPDREPGQVPPGVLAELARPRLVAERVAQQPEVSVDHLTGHAEARVSRPP